MGTIAPNIQSEFKQNEDSIFKKNVERTDTIIFCSSREFQEKMFKVHNAMIKM